MGLATTWSAACYLAGLAQARFRAMTAGKEAGALSLEWIVIGVLLVAAATAAGVAFTTAIGHEASKLP
jgi:hypothetical protein